MSSTIPTVSPILISFSTFIFNFYIFNEISYIYSTFTYFPILTGSLYKFPLITPTVVLNVLIGYLISYKANIFPLLHLFPVTV